MHRPTRLRRPPLRAALATPAAKRRYVADLFERIAGRYDLITVLLSYGRDRRWKARLVEMAQVRASERALDLACGTGDLAFALADRAARVVGLDFAPAMVAHAVKKRGVVRQPVDFVVGDLTSIPIASESANLVTAGYALRNVPVLDEALAEIRRVLAPGGRMLSLDFNRPSNPLVRAAYLAYLTAIGSIVGLVLHGDADTYRYIAESLRRYPGAAAVAQRMRELGFVDVGWQPLLGGLMAINEGRKPADGVQ
jgi:demethylmenaquinone methyltransferase / 2-methoxy-6-polyprenyl-1,4-benzoquinol methylase